LNVEGDNGKGAAEILDGKGSGDKKNQREQNPQHCFFMHSLFSLILREKHSHIFSQFQGQKVKIIDLFLCRQIKIMRADYRFRSGRYSGCPYSGYY